MHHRPFSYRRHRCRTFVSIVELHVLPIGTSASLLACHVAVGHAALLGVEQPELAGIIFSIESSSL
jgi:hypothetical protein